MFRPVATPPPPCMSRPRSPIMLQALPYEVKQNNPLWGARICKNFDNEWFPGRVVDVEADERTGELAYCVEYDDGDSEHLCEREVRANLWRLTGVHIRPSCAPSPSGHGSRRSSLAPVDAVTRPSGIAVAQDSASPRIGLALAGLFCVIALFIGSWSWDSLTSAASNQQYETSGVGVTPEFANTRFEPDAMLSGISLGAPKAADVLEDAKYVTLTTGSAFNLGGESVERPYVAAQPMKDQPKVPDANTQDLDNIFKATEQHGPSSMAPLDTSASGSLPPVVDLAHFEYSWDASADAMVESTADSAMDWDIILGLLAFIALVAAFCVLRSSAAANANIQAPLMTLASNDDGSQLVNSPLLRSPIHTDPYISPVPAPNLGSSPSPIASTSLIAASSPAFQPQPQTTLLATPQSSLQRSYNVLVPTPTRSSALRSSQASYEPMVHHAHLKEGSTPSAFRYSSGLEQMKAMGFEDTADLREALTSNQGHVAGALREYLN